MYSVDLDEDMEQLLASLVDPDDYTLESHAVDQWDSFGELLDD